MARSTRQTTSRWPEALDGLAYTAGEALLAAVADSDHAGFLALQSALSDQQRKAMLEALELGYHDIPRAATCRDVAARLDCTPSTASEHLQKAESKLARTAIEGSDV